MSQRARFALLFLIACSLYACTGPAPVLTPQSTRLQPSATPNATQALTRVAIGATPTPRPSPTPFPLATATPTRQTNDDPDINPLTGQKAQNPDLLQQPPVLVKIANWPQTLRPPSGLNRADIVFEYYIGNQMNHLLALFYGADSPAVGPLAPARAPDLHLTEHYQANIVYASAPGNIQTNFDKYLPYRSYQRGFVPCPGICTETEAQGGNTYVNTEALRAHIAEQRHAYTQSPVLSGQVFSDTVEQWDEVATRLSYLYADFSVMDWRYNTSNQRYELFQDFNDGKGQVSLQPSFERAVGAEKGEPIAFENVLILFGEYSPVKGQIYDLNLREGDSNQQALLLRDGKLIHALWSTADYLSPIRFYDQNGAPLALKPGRSWIVFATKLSEVRQYEPGLWDVSFSLR